MRDKGLNQILVSLDDKFAKIKYYQSDCNFIVAMNAQSFLFLCLCFNQFISIKSYCYFKYWNGEKEFWYYDCFCGSKKEQFSEDYGDKYCCVHQNSLNDCQIDVLTNGIWCPNATLLSQAHICNSNCFQDSSQDICPSNPETCTDLYRGCDGRERCEAFCAGPVENFPYYDQKVKNCLYDYPYCEIRDEAKYHNHQCISYYLTRSMIKYRCLNRKDVRENTIRSSVNHDSFVKARKNLFQYFKANDTMNQVTGTQIICDNQNITMDCSGLPSLRDIE